MGIIQLKTGNYRVISDRFLLEGLTEQERKERIKTYLRENLRGNFYQSISDHSVLSIATQSSELHKLDKPGIKMNKDKYYLRQLAITHLDELAEVSRFIRMEVDYKRKHGKDVVGFEKRSAEFEVIDFRGNKPYIRVFDLELTICCRNNKRTIYDISRINKKDTYSVIRRHIGRLTEISKVSYEKTISEIPGYVKSNPLPISRYQQQLMQANSKEKGEKIMSQKKFQNAKDAAEEKRVDPIKGRHMEERQRLFVDMDGTLAVFTPVDELETLYEKGYFLNQDPHENVLDAVRDIIRDHPDIEVHILSAVLTDSKYALQEKNEWLDRYLPEIDHEHRVFVPCGSDKKEGIQGGIRDNDFLLDDYTHNLNDWQPPARGIKLLNAINHTRGSWEHDRIRYDREPTDLAKGILSIMRSERQIFDEKVNQMKGEGQKKMAQEMYQVGEKPTAKKLAERCVNFIENNASSYGYGKEPMSQESKERLTHTITENLLQDGTDDFIKNIRLHWGGNAETKAEIAAIIQDYESYTRGIPDIVGSSRSVGNIPVIDKETGEVNVKLHPGKLVHPVDLIDSIEIQYAVRLRDGQTLHISQEELLQIADVRSFADISGLAQYEAIERKVEEVMDIVETGKDYSITISRESGENVCNIVFRDREKHSDVILRGEHLGVYFPALPEEQLKNTVKYYLEQQEKAKESMDLQTEWKPGDQVSFYMSKYSFDQERAYISGVQEVKGVLENISYSEPDGCNVYTIKDNNNFYSLAYGNEIYNKGQLMILAAAQQKLPNEQFQIVANTRFNGAQMWEIYTGFQKGLSVEQVSKYANPEVPAWKMDVHRYGMHHGITDQKLQEIITQNPDRVDSWANSRQRIEEYSKDRRREILKDIKSQGYNGGDYLVRRIKSLDGITGKEHNLKDICKAFREGSYEGTEAGSIIRELGGEFQRQESIQRKMAENVSEI